MTDLIVPTKRRKMSRARAAAIFLREQGRCYLCGRKLRIGVDHYQIEHPEALSLGGSDDDADLRVVCTDCHKPKTAADAAAKARRDRFVTQGWEPETRPHKRKMQGPGFRKSAPQRSATRPITRHMDGSVSRREGTET